MLVDDVAVPLPLLPEMLRRIEAIAAETQTTVATVALTAFEAMMAQAIELGGTITGEDGVGTLKRGFLARQLGAASLALHHRIKQAFDPDGILNPGKVIGPPGGSRPGGERR